jgi:hypothetical protein
MLATEAGPHDRVRAVGTGLHLFHREVNRERNMDSRTRRNVLRNVAAIGGLLLAHAAKAQHTCGDYPGPCFPVDPTGHCFLRGTHLLTSGGDRAIEDMAVGDTIVTARGPDTVIRIDRRRTMASADTPVCVEREALGPGQPYRDLWVSAEHALLIDGMLIRAAALVNNRSIYRDVFFLEIEYLHVEVAYGGPGIIYAEGVACESLTQHERGDVVAFNGRDRLKSHARRALAPLFDLRTPYDKVLDRLEERA